MNLAREGSFDIDQAAATPARLEGMPAQGQALSVRELEQRRLIHRNDSLREHADAFRELRTKLLAMGAGANVIQVSPIRHGCGGSFVARNLAAAFAFDESKSALLMDCDARYPSQAAVFGIDSHAGGLVDYLEGGSLPLEAIVHPSGLPRLDVVPAGKRRETVGEMFSSARMRLMIDSLRDALGQRFIILDGPPVEGSPDARILSESADLVVLVAGQGEVTAEAVRKSVAAFTPEKMAGVVFNQRP